MRISIKLNSLIVVFLALFLSGCMSTFSLVDKGFAPKGNSIAVIPGIDDDMNLAIASQITQSLNEQSRYKVMSQQSIKRKLGTYPINVQGPYKSAYFDIDVDWSRTDTSELAAIQRKLKTDYLYVLWAPTAVSYNGSPVATIGVVAQMYEYPSMKLVGQGRYNLRAAKNDPHYLKISARKVAIALSKRTGMIKE